MLILQRAAPSSSRRETKMAEAAAAPAAAPAKSNAGYYMKNAFFSMITVTIATQAVNFLMGKEAYVACKVGVNDNTWLTQRYESLRFFDPKTAVHTTQYVPMRDGVELALDTYIADYLLKNDNKVPTVIAYTRHGRGYDLDFPFNVFTQYEKKFMNPRTSIYTQRFVTNGYAWINVDARGTGASAGAKKHDFADQEVEDAHDIIEWVTQQPWSNGKVAAFGHGLEGVGALLFAASGHPALKAISLNGAPVDVYQSAFFPGGVKNHKGLDSFSSFTHDTDRQIRWREIPTFKPRLMMKHFGGTVYPVDDNAAKLAAYVGQHADNPNLSEELKDVHFRDDKLAHVDATVSELDAIRHLGKIASSGVAIHSFAGYYDMGTARSSIMLFQYLTNTLDAETAALLPKLPEDADTNPLRHRLTLGPWSHAGVDNSDPFGTSKQKCFWHVDEISRFFDYHLYDNRKKLSTMDSEDPIHYFSVVHSKWKSTVTWPPAYLSKRVYYVGAENSMGEVVTASGQETINVAHNSLYDVDSRWNFVSHLFGVKPFYYHDREQMSDQFVTFLTPEIPLSEMTGEVELRLFFSVDEPNVNLVAYLEDVDYKPVFKNENKRRGVTYITEALLNPIHKTVSKESSVHSFLKKDAQEIKPGVVYEAVLRFQPISYVIKRDHQLRLSIGVAPPADFAAAGPNQATKLTVHYGAEYPTSISLPTHEGLYTSNIVPALDNEELESIPTPQTTSESAAEAGEDEFEAVETKDEL